MTSRDATRSNGTRCRQQADREVHHIREHDSAPEWGNRFTCVACWQHNIPDLTRHRNQHCDDWNALNRINCGFQRQWREGRAALESDGSCPARAHVLSGEHCRMVKGRCGILPHHVVRWQNENFGPCDPLEVPQGVNMLWRGFSCCNLLQETLMSLPTSISTVPRQCTCSRALMRSMNGTAHSCHHEKNALDELVCQAAIGDFMGSHPFLVGACQNQMNVHWQTTQPFLARNSQQPLNGMGNWVDLSPPDQGVCGVGDRGIAESNAEHFLACTAAAVNGMPLQHMNLCTGKTIHDARRGQFAMPGTPRRQNTRNQNVDTKPHNTFSRWNCFTKLFHDMFCEIVLRNCFAKLFCDMFCEI